MLAASLRGARPHTPAPPPALDGLPPSLAPLDTSLPSIDGLDAALDALLRGTNDAPRPLTALYREVHETCTLSDDAAHALATRVHARLKRGIEALVSTLGPPPADPAPWALRLCAQWHACAARLPCIAQLLAPLLTSAAYTHTPDIDALCFAHLTQQVRQVLRAEHAVVRGAVALAGAVRERDLAHADADSAQDDAPRSAGPSDAPARTEASLAEAPARNEPWEEARTLRASPERVREDPAVDDLGALFALGRRMGLDAALHAALVEDAETATARLDAELVAARGAPARLQQSAARVAAHLARMRAWAPWAYGDARVVDAAQTALVAAHAEALAALTPALLDAHAHARLAQVYRLLARADALPPLRAALGAYVREAGGRIVRGDAESLVAALLAFYDAMQRVLGACFAGDAALNHALRDGFEACVNARESRVAELLARYADAQLRAGNTRRTDAELDACLAQVLALFRFVRDKDLFEEFYKRCFARRLLLARSASDDAERSMLLKLKAECGPDFTAQLETMLKDTQLSDELMAAYAPRRGPMPFDFEVSVLTQAHWPTFPETHVALPAPMRDALAHFEAFYPTCHAGRTLHWRHALGSLLVTADLGRAGVRELQLSTFQAAVLLAFNGEARDARLSYATLAARTQLPPSELQRTLQSLACGAIPTRVLRKHPQGRDVHETDHFTVNEALKNERRRIRINQIQHRDTREEQRSTEQRVFIDRELLLQAAAMRVLKARKTIRHAELTTEVVHQIRNRFAVDAAELKKAFERLIEKDCMERVEGERGMYRYIA